MKFSIKSVLIIDTEARTLHELVGVNESRADIIIETMYNARKSNKDFEFQVVIDAVLSEAMTDAEKLFGLILVMKKYGELDALNDISRKTSNISSFLADVLSEKNNIESSILRPDDLPPHVKKAIIDAMDKKKNRGNNPGNDPNTPFDGKLPDKF